jgi:hypothetical protein
MRSTEQSGIRWTSAASSSMLPQQANSSFKADGFAAV